MAERNSTNRADNVVETRKTFCKVTTQDVVATAEATASKMLTGVCTSGEDTDFFILN